MKYRWEIMNDEDKRWAVKEEMRLVTHNGTTKDDFVEIMRFQAAEIERLQAELAQSVRLPCKNGDTIVDDNDTFYSVTGYSEGICEPLTITAASISDGNEGELAEFEADEFGKTVFLAETAQAAATAPEAGKQ